MSDGTPRDTGKRSFSFIGALDDPPELSERTIEQVRLRASMDDKPIYITKSSGEQDSFSGGGVRDRESGKPRFDLVRPLAVPYADQMLTRWAALMARGAERYTDRNWEQMHDQAALDRFRSSAARHFEQWLAGETDEDHGAACFFNIQGAEYVAGKIRGDW